MPSEQIEVSFPFKGISDDKGFGAQDPLTTRQAQNVRGIDPKTGRTRGAQRAGLSQFNTTKLNGANKVKDIQGVIRDNQRIAYAETIAVADTFARATLTAVGTTDAPGEGDTVKIGETTYTWLADPSTGSIFSILRIPGALASTHFEILRNVVNDGGSGLGLTFGGETPNRFARGPSEPGVFASTTITFTALVGGVGGANTGNSTKCVTNTANWSWIGATFNSDTPGTDGTPHTEVDTVFTKDLQAAYSPVTDRQGNVYVLGSNATIYKYNSELTFLYSVNLPVSAADVLVRFLLIDEFDNLYAAAKNGESSTSRIWKLSQDHDEDSDRIEVVWEVDDAPGEIVMMDVRNGALAVVERRVDDLVSTVAQYGFLNSAVPLRVWEQAVPHPVNAVAIGSQGAHYTSSEANVTRGQTPNSGDFGAITEDFTLHDIPNATERLHFWVDAQSVELAEGALVETWKNRKLAATTIASPPGTYEPPVDEVPRDLFKKGSGNRRQAPRYRKFGMGENPGVHFDADVQIGDFAGSVGSLLRTARNITADGKLSTSDDLPKQKNVFPGYTQYDNGVSPAVVVGMKYCVAMVVRFTKEDKASIVFQQWTSPQNYTLVANMSATGSLAPGYFTLIANNVSAATFTNTWNDSAAAWQAPAADGTGTWASTTVLGHARFDKLPQDATIATAAAPTDNPTYACIIVIQFGGKDAALASSWRVNGRTIARWTATEDVAIGSKFNARTYLGQAMVNERPPLDFASGGTSIPGVATGNGIPGTDAVPGTFRCGKFEGYIAEIATVLGDSTNTNRPNDLQMTIPLTGGGAGRGVPVDPSAANPLLGYEGSAVAGVAAAASEIEKIEGAIAHRWGMQSFLLNVSSGLSGGLYQRHPYYLVRPDAIIANTGFSFATGESHVALSSQRPVLAKWSPQGGELIWALAGSGLGYGVVPDSNNDVFTVGKAFDGGATDTPSVTDEDLVIARKVIDNGLTYDALEANGAWLIKAASAATLPFEEQQYPHVKLFVDEKDFFYWPISNKTFSNHIRKIRGVDRTAGDPGASGHTADSGLGGNTYWESSLSSPVQVFGIAFGKNNPDFVEAGEAGEDTISGPEYYYLAADNKGNNTIPTLYKLRKVGTTRSDGAPRTIVYVGVARDDIIVFDNTSLTPRPSGGEAALDATSQYVMSTVHRGKVYYTDGAGPYKCFDPTAITDALDTDAASGKVTTFESTSAGIIPPRCKLISSWRNRLVVARGDDPHEWTMSKVGDPENWDLYPSVIAADIAVSGTSENSTVGTSPDIINAVIPYTDDVMFLGGDHTVYQITGDPMAGGEMDLLSDITGIAFGQAWAKDPQGYLYFFGSKGGVYVVVPGRTPRRISVNRIERRMQDVDLALYKIRLAWNYHDEGLHVFLTPLATTWAASVKHWFWDKKSDAWWEDKFGTTATAPQKIQPTAVMVVDGDLVGDRQLLIGGEDGIVRKWDRDAKSDKAADNTDIAIDSFVTMGPAIPSGLDTEVRFTHLGAVMADDQAGCAAEFFVEDSPEAFNEPVVSFQLNPGRNPYRLMRVRGSHIWVRLRNAALNQRWALEHLSMRATGAGRKRVRT